MASEGYLENKVREQQVSLDKLENEIEAVKLELRRNVEEKQEAIKAAEKKMDEQFFKLKTIAEDKLNTILLNDFAESLNEIKADYREAYKRQSANHVAQAQMMIKSFGSLTKNVIMELQSNMAAGSILNSLLILKGIYTEQEYENIEKQLKRNPMFKIMREEIAKSITPILSKDEMMVVDVTEFDYLDFKEMKMWEEKRSHEIG